MPIRREYLPEYDTPDSPLPYRRHVVRSGAEAGELAAAWSRAHEAKHGAETDEVTEPEETAP